MTSRLALPTVEQVVDLPRLLETAVTDEHEDANGHLNITGFLTLHERAARPWLAGLGLDPSASEDARGIMDLEHQLRYLAEVHVSDRVAVDDSARAGREAGPRHLVPGQPHPRATGEHVRVRVRPRQSQKLRRAAPFDPDTPLR